MAHCRAPAVANRWVYVLAIAIFFAYVAWMLDPYIRSAIVRDASVTTWSRAAVAPIAGRIVTALPAGGSTIGEHGHVATIYNDLLLHERSEVEDTRDRAMLARTRIDEAREYLGKLEALDRTRVDTRNRQVEIFHAQLELRLAASRARHELHAAEAALSEASEDLAWQQQMIDALTRADVTAPPGSVVFSVTAAPGSTVTAGERIIEWIDCSALMVDVPVSDAELPLIGRETRPEVVLEGEAQVRGATVLLTRGSSATLAGADLAAIAKGRTQGVAQVPLALDAERAQFERCPVGWAACLEFPDVGILDILRARLRL